ncbi:MAG: DUF1838 family protein [Rhodospirillaceae bacterium]
MMKTQKIPRRHALATAGGVSLSVATATTTATRTRAQAPSFDLSDPATSLDAYVKLRGSTADETVYQVYSGNIFQAVPGEVPRPVIGFWGLQKSNWRSDGAGGYLSTDYDLGLYIDPESRKVLSTWENHLTGKSLDVLHYRSGPSEGTHSLTAEGESAYGTFTDNWQMSGDQVVHETTTWSDRKNLLQPADYPLGSTGERFRTSMSYSLMGRKSELRDPALRKAPCSYIWSFIAPWPPWMEMGQRDDFVVWRWVGHKLMSRSEIPQDLIDGVEAVWPGYVDDKRPWEEGSSGWHQYKWLKDGHTPT